MTATPDCRTLIIDWDSGETTQLSAALLRREARDAGSIRQRVDFGSVRVDDDIAITALAPVGSVGVNIHFSDGHDRAIYPFAYLLELSERGDK
ncbi:DUF971 domain-containing protein [Meridianimarinicoccus roseus]|jgi:DUF971 family protein|uniref:DUF971 domain-containing protein n=1 Tax=Meridianimarinicoccus roseus TaxID=2072018 RepID=A0A2V2LEY5_9RHOB|nr:DUF971 domain-containing protein [Meridianimarinicoccus roseus]PWR04160.1 DUF971 domain-containing protein [Meridianimarinicoccus roseus]